MRSYCLICGKMEKQCGAGYFRKIHGETIETGNGNLNLSKKLQDILGIDVRKPKWVSSDQICKKCLRNVMNIVNLEEQARER